MIMLFLDQSKAITGALRIVTGTPRLGTGALEFGTSTARLIMDDLSVVTSTARLVVSTSNHDAHASELVSGTSRYSSSHRGFSHVLAEYSPVVSATVPHPQFGSGSGLEPN